VAWHCKIHCCGLSSDCLNAIKIKFSADKFSKLPTVGRSPISWKWEEVTSLAAVDLAHSPVEPYGLIANCRNEDRGIGEFVAAPICHWIRPTGTLQQGEAQAGGLAVITVFAIIQQLTP